MMTLFQYLAYEASKTLNATKTKKPLSQSQLSSFIPNKRSELGPDGPVNPESGLWETPFYGDLCNRELI